MQDDKNLYNILPLEKRSYKCIDGLSKKKEKNSDIIRGRGGRDVTEIGRESQRVLVRLRETEKEKRVKETEIKQKRNKGENNAQGGKREIERERENSETIETRRKRETQKAKGCTCVS